MNGYTRLFDLTSYAVCVTSHENNGHICVELMTSHSGGMSQKADIKFLIILNTIWITLLIKDNTYENTNRTAWKEMASKMIL